MNWSLYQEGKFLEPLKFSSGKSQADIVQEVLDAIEEGHKVIFIHGMCGTGKSAIALNIARKLGKSSIIVPGKNLQKQYKKDYEGKKQVLKDNKEQLKISVITGRNNHKCKFLEDNQNAIPKIKKEINAKLHDIFSGKREEIKNIIDEDISADNHNIPCKIEIKEKNWNKIKAYLKQNKDVDWTNFLEIKDVKRMSIAPACPYWSPVIPEEYEIKNFESVKRRSYTGLNNLKFNFYQRENGCKFYEQFNSYIDSDVIVFNSLKYKLEFAMSRKPLTETEIIDEYDEFLDNLSNQRIINLERLQKSLSYLIPENEKIERIFIEINEIINHIKRNKKTNELINSKGIISLRETGIYDLFRIFLKSNEFIQELDEENYLFEVEETARMFKDFFDETYLTFDKKENSILVSIVTTNLEKKFKEIVDKNKIIILMSGTLHSEEVLEKVFGLKKFKKIEAEIQHQGNIEVQRTGLEMDCKYSNFSSGKFTREEYLKSLSKCVEVAKRPVLVHVNAFLDLPSEEELEKFDIDNLIGREKLKDLQREDKEGILVDRFKKGQTNVLFTTRCNRGVDFPGEECNSIIFTKYPNPNVQDAFWKILNKTRPDQYWDFYRDKAKRELWQKVYRGLRHKKDHVFLLSPDSRVLDFFEENQ